MENKDYESQRREKNILKDKKTLSLDFSAKEDLLSEEQTCANCFFWFYGATGTPKYGECRRNAPIPLLYSPEEREVLKTLVFWPAVVEDDWCGEWKEVS